MVGKVVKHILIILGTRFQELKALVNLSGLNTPLRSIDLKDLIKIKSNHRFGTFSKIS
jgi:hypothetical protein